MRLDFRAYVCKYMYICVCKYGVNIYVLCEGPSSFGFSSLYV